MAGASKKSLDPALEHALKNRQTVVKMFEDLIRRTQDPAKARQLREILEHHRKNLEEFKKSNGLTESE